MTELQIIKISTRSDGMDVAEAEWCGQTFKATSRNGVTMAIARTLATAGCPDGPWEGWGSGESVRRLHGPSLHGLAGLTVSEPDRARPRFVFWRPYVQPEGEEAA